MQRAWVAVVVVVGIILGVAIAGVPSRHHDTPLRVTSTTTSAPGTTTSTAPPAP